MMKFHLHVVDGNATAAASPSPSASTGTTAAMLFAHLTLRCGHLNEIVAVSASTTPATARAAALQAAASRAGGTSSAAAAVMSLGADEEGAVSDDTRVLQYASEVLRGVREVHGAGDTAVALPYVDGGEGQMTPYAYFATAFPAAERTLRQAITIATAAVPGAPPPPPYFDMIATTDMATFDYVIEYYQRQRAQYGGAAVKGRGTKPVGVVHIVADDPSRAAQVLQRVLEMTLKRSGFTFAVDANAAAAEEEEAAAAAAAEDAEDAEGSDEDGSADGDGEGVEGGGGTGGSSGRHAAGGAGGSRAGRAVGGVSDSWVNHVDEAVHLFARLFNVDVLVALV